MGRLLWGYGEILKKKISTVEFIEGIDHFAELRLNLFGLGACLYRGLKRDRLRVCCPVKPKKDRQILLEKY